MSQATPLQSITCHQLNDLVQQGKNIELIDVRTPMEFQEVHAKIARNKPLDQLDPKLVMQERRGAAEEPLYVICRSGSRGQKACTAFLKAGIDNVVHVEGGMHDWEAAIDRCPGLRCGGKLFY